MLVFLFMVQILVPMDIPSNVYSVEVAESNIVDRSTQRDLTLLVKS